MSPDWSARPIGVPYAEFTDPESLNLYAYVRNNPLNKVDASGHYTCDTGQNQQQCSDFKKTLATVQNAASNLKEGSKERKRLEGILKFYGKENDHKGPTIHFGDLGGDVGRTVTEHGKTTITFDPAQLAGMSKVGKAESVAHEGSHGVDDHKPGVAAGAFWTFYDTEYHAYQSEAAVDRGLGKKNETDGAHPAWAPMMSDAQQAQNITRNAFANAQADCGEDPACHP